MKKLLVAFVFPLVCVIAVGCNKGDTKSTGKTEKDASGNVTKSEVIKGTGPATTKATEKVTEKATEKATDAGGTTEKKS